MTGNKREMPSNVVYIGKDRKLMDYVTPILTIMNNGENEIIVKSRGQANNNNLSLNQYILNKVFKNQLRLKSIDVGTEALKNRDNNMVNVTTLCIKYLKV